MLLRIHHSATPFRTLASLNPNFAAALERSAYNGLVAVAFTANARSIFAKSQYRSKTCCAHPREPLANSRPTTSSKVHDAKESVLVSKSLYD